MLKSIIISNGVSSIDLMHNDDLTLMSIEGVSPESQINTSSLSGYDGSTVVSSNVPMRQISILLRFFEGDAEIAKHSLYSIFPIRKNIELYYVSDLGIKVINCLTEKVDIPPNDYPLSAQISLICPSPYFTDLEPKSKIMSAVTPLFKFPFTFNGPFKFGERMASVIENFVNDSTVDVYPIIEFKAISALTNPSIMNINTYEKMKVNVSLAAGEKLRIDTRIGKKSITKISGSEETNCFNCMTDDFKFFKLYTGDNYLKYDADTNAAGLQTTVQWENLYGGV